MHHSCINQDWFYWILPKRMIFWLDQSCSYIAFKHQIFLSLSLMLCNRKMSLTIILYATWCCFAWSVGSITQVPYLHICRGWLPEGHLTRHQTIQSLLDSLNPKQFLASEPPSSPWWLPSPSSASQSTEVVMWQQCFLCHSKLRLHTNTKLNRRDCYIFYGNTHQRL